MTTERPYGKVAVFKGGISPEREVSLRSGAAVADGLRVAGYEVEEVDVVDETPLIPAGVEGVFIALHGTFGEDGGVQRYLSGRNIPYTGSDAVASMVAFDKKVTKQRLMDKGVLTASFEVLRLGDKRTLELPVVVKPTCQGSSVGISRVFSEEEWGKALQKAFEYGEEILVERFVDGRECTVGIVGDIALPILEIVVDDGYYDYAAKYTKGTTHYNVPADLVDSVADNCRETAHEVFRLLGCRGVARVDFLVAVDGRAYVLELNSIPGFTKNSLLPKAAAAAGIEFSELCDRIMRMAAL